MKLGIAKNHLPVQSMTNLEVFGRLNVTVDATFCCSFLTGHQPHSVQEQVMLID